jgi:hypothetical protein
METVEDVFKKYAEDNYCDITFDQDNILLYCKGTTISYEFWLKNIYPKINNSSEI